MPDTLLHLNLEHSDVLIPEVRLLESGPLDKVIPSTVNKWIVANLDYDDECIPVFSIDDKEIFSNTDFRETGEYVCLEYDKTRFCVLCKSSEEIMPEKGHLRSLPECMLYTDSIIRDVMVIENRLFLQINLNVIIELVNLYKQQNHTHE